MVHSSIRGHGGVQYQDVWHILFPSMCVSHHPSESWKLLSAEREGKQGMPRCEIGEVNQSNSLHTLVSLLNFLWDAEAFGPIIVVGQWMLGWRKQVLKEGGKWFILGGKGGQDGQIWPLYRAISSGTQACAQRTTLLNYWPTSKMAVKLGLALVLSCYQWVNWEVKLTWCTSDVTWWILLYFCSPLP